MQTMIRVAIAWVASGMALVPAAPGARIHPVLQCGTPISWTTPRSLLSESSPLREHQISDMAFDGSHIVAIADTAPEGPLHHRVIGTTYDLVTGVAQTLQAPAGRFHFLHPKVALLGGDTVLLVWAEPGTDTISAALNQETNPQSLWYATFARGGWSRAQALPLHASFGWDGVRASELLRTPDGSVHLVVPAYSRLVPGFLAHFRLRDDRVRVDELHLQTEAAYAAIVGDDSGVTTAFVAPVPDTAQDDNSVWLVRYPAVGSVGVPEVVSRSGHRPANFPQVTEARGGGITVTWQRAGELGTGHQVIQSMRRAPGDKAWSRKPEDAPASQPLQLYSSFTGAADSQGVLYLNAAGALRVARWCAGRVSDDEVPTHGMFAGSTRAAVSRGVVVVAWTAGSSISGEAQHRDWVLSQLR